MRLDGGRQALLVISLIRLLDLIVKLGKVDEA
jgi:hypothetical protein